MHFRDWAVTGAGPIGEGLARCTGTSLASSIPHVRSGGLALALTSSTRSRRSPTCQRWLNFCLVSRRRLGLESLRRSKHRRRLLNGSIDSPTMRARLAEVDGEALPGGRIRQKDWRGR
jgi:hypothetical protein